MNKRKHKEYDEYDRHEYPGAPNFTSDCKHGCGCTAGRSHSSGPPGVDPFGRCPNNPLDGKRQEGNDDYEDCVNGLIRKLKQELAEAKQAVEIVEMAKANTKVDLAKRLTESELEANEWEKIVNEVNRIVNKMDKVFNRP